MAADLPGVVLQYCPWYGVIHAGLRVTLSSAMVCWLAATVEFSTHTYYLVTVPVCLCPNASCVVALAASLSCISHGTRFSVCFV